MPTDPLNPIQLEHHQEHFLIKPRSTFFDPNNNNNNHNKSNSHSTTKTNNRPPPLYLPDSYQPDLLIHQTSKTQSIDHHHHPTNNNNNNTSNKNPHLIHGHIDSDAEGSLEIIDQSDPPSPHPISHPPTISIDHHHLPTITTTKTTTTTATTTTTTTTTAAAATTSTTSTTSTQTIIPSPSTSSSHQAHKTLHSSSSPKHPLSFTIPSNVYLKPKATKKDSLTRRRIISLESTTDEDQDHPPSIVGKSSHLPLKRKPKLRRKAVLSDSDDQSEVEHQIITSPHKTQNSKDQRKIIKNQKRSRTQSSSSNSPFSRSQVETESSEAESSEPGDDDDDDDDDDDQSIKTLRKTASRRSKTRASDHQPITKKLRRTIDLDSTEDDNDDDDRADGDWCRRHHSDPDTDDDHSNQTVTIDEALRFFNQCHVTDLPAVTACTLEQAKTIVGCRPFKDAEDMKKKLRQKKGVTAGVLNHYQDMMKGYFQVDRVLNQCEKHGRDLARIMNVWAGKNQDLDQEAGQPGLGEEGAIDLIDHLSDPISIRSTEQRLAFKDYIFDQPSPIPSGIKLKSYQMLGLNWLYLLYSKGLSCILADEMGLGKTAQVVCFLSHLKSIGKPGPHLVIVPSSTLDNWIREFSNFSSNLIVSAYYGSQSERSELRYELKSSPDLDVVITTYNIATGNVDDKKFLDRMRFDACVYDEGHQLKNSQSKRYKDLMRQNVRWRLLLTGTPLQNNLQELVSLLSFILPKIFVKAEKDLRMIFKVPTEAQANLLAQTRITRAKKMMSPFVLRRKKAQVLKELPKKIEKVIYCDMEVDQLELYNQIIKRSKKYLIQPSSSDSNQKFDELFPDRDDEEEEEDRISFQNNGLLGGKGSTRRPAQAKRVQSNSTTNVLMELRKASNHPLLFRRLYDDQKIRQIAKACLKEVNFMDSKLDLIIEDLEVMNDFEIHLLCESYKGLNRFGLNLNDEVLKSGKVQSLKEILIENQLNQPSHDPGSSRASSDSHSDFQDDDQPAVQASRFLIFSQFTQMLEILKVFLSSLGIKFLTLTGQTNVVDRQPLVDRFTHDPEITVFLLSTRAGGLGLNLMAADTVVIFDQDFNPHNDRQAEDRAYRLGQTRDVTVLKLISKATIEEDILELASMKIEIDKSISSNRPTIDDSSRSKPSTSSSSKTTTTDGEAGGGGGAEDGQLRGAAASTNEDPSRRTTVVIDGAAAAGHPQPSSSSLAVHGLPSLGSTTTTTESSSHDPLGGGLEKSVVIKNRLLESLRKRMFSTSVES